MPLITVYTAGIKMLVVVALGVGLYCTGLIKTHDKQLIKEVRRRSYIIISGISRLSFVLFQIRDNPLFMVHKYLGFFSIFGTCVSFLLTLMIVTSQVAIVQILN